LPVLKGPREIERLRNAGRVACLALQAAVAAAKPGASTREVDRVAEAVILEHGATPEFKGYQSFPAATCISVNDEVVHGIPGGRILLQGDLVKIDVGARLDGYVGDNAATTTVGDADETSHRLVETTRRCLEEAILACQVGGRLSEVGRAIQSRAESDGFHIIRDYAGHGIGARLHEEPQVPNYVDERVLGQDIVLEPGLCIAIEPMVSAGDGSTRELDDGWTVVTADGARSAHFEDVVAITKDGPFVLTRP